MENKNNKRYQDTHKRLKTVFRQLALQMPLAKITVAKIISTAQVNRKTFYLHWETIEFLHEEITREMSELLVERYRKHIALDTLNTAEALHQALIFIIEEPDPFTHHVITEKDAFPLYQEMMAQLVQKLSQDFAHYLQLTDDKRQLLFSYITSGFMMLYRKWYHSGKNQSLDELKSLAFTLISSNIETIEILVTQGSNGDSL